MTSDPKGYYARLGVEPAAPPAAIAAAFRRKARLLHPDVPGTGNAEAFIRAKEAYDVLADPIRRSAYDRQARQDVEAARTGAHAYSWSSLADDLATKTAAGPQRVPGIKLSAWLGLLIVTAVASVETVRHLIRVQAPPEMPLSQFIALTPTEPAQPPLGFSASPRIMSARPVGAPTHYVAPGMGPAIIWQRDPTSGHLSPVGRLGPFAGVHALSPRPEQGLLAIALSGGVGYVEAPRLVAGSRTDARRARCAYEAGPSPLTGESLTRRDPGPARITIRNHASDPAVVKLRDPTGATVASIYIDADSFVVATDLPSGPWRADIAFGTLWSRSCGRFAAAQQTKRLLAPVLPGTVLDIAPDEAGGTEPIDISDEAFAHD